MSSYSFPLQMFQNRVKSSHVKSCSYHLRANVHVSCEWFLCTQGCERDDGVNEGSFRTCGRRGCFSVLLGGSVDALLVQIVLKMWRGDEIQKKRRKGQRDACWDTRAGGLSVMPALNETYLDITTARFCYFSLYHFSE